MMRCRLLVFTAAVVLPSGVLGQATGAADGSIGSVRAAMVERIRPQDSAAILGLSISTVRQFGCLGYTIAHSRTQTPDTIRVVLASIVPPPGNGCALMAGPAEMLTRLDHTIGRVALVISSSQATDTLLLESSRDSIALSSITHHFVQADERVRWRFPSKSFALVCGGVPRTSRLCDDLIRWIGRLPGVTPMAFRSNGLSPYFPGPVSPDASVQYYRFSAAAALSDIAACFRALAPLLQETVGIRIKLVPWTGAVFGVGSARALDEPHSEIPTSVAVCGE